MWLEEKQVIFLTRKEALSISDLIIHYYLNMSLRNTALYLNQCSQYPERVT